MTATVKSYPLNEIDESFDVADTYNSDEIVQYLWVDVREAATDQYIEIVYNGVTKTLLITDECRYTPVDIAFQNKEGALQIMTFFKAKKDSISLESETFESSREILTHQFVKYNVNAKVKFTASSGFLTEDKNETIKELLLSERVWMITESRAAAAAKSRIPLNVSTTAQEFKTRQNDKLINYVIEFEHAFFENNNV